MFPTASPFPRIKSIINTSGWEVGSCAVLDTVWGGFPVGSRWALVGSAWVPLALPCTHWFPRLKQLLCVRESESRMYVAQLWPSACPCTLIVVPMRVLFPKKKENRSARFAKAATSSYLVDVSPTHSFARCVGLVGRLGLGRAHVRMDSSRLYSSSKPTSDPARSPTCVRLSV